MVSANSKQVLAHSLETFSRHLTSGCILKLTDEKLARGIKRKFQAQETAIANKVSENFEKTNYFMFCKYQLMFPKLLFVKELVFYSQCHGLEFWVISCSMRQSLLQRLDFHFSN